MHVLPAFKAAGKGSFLTTGGGLEANGAWACGFGQSRAAACVLRTLKSNDESLRACVRLRVCCDVFAGFQLGAPSKAYFRNWAEAMHATHSKVCTLLPTLVRTRVLRCVLSPNASVPQQSQTLSHTRSLPPSPCNRTACVLSTCKCNISKRVTSASSCYSSTHFHSASLKPQRITHDAPPPPPLVCL